MSKTVIVGGGLSGLSAALFLKLKNLRSSVTIIEASERLGGWIRSNNFKDGSVHELGPRTIRMNSPTVNYLLQVIENIKLSDQLISISKENKTFQKRYIFAKNQLNLLDFSLLKPAQKPFSESFLLKIVKAALQKYKHESNFQDLPIDYFVRTRFGDEIADYVINPVIRGIYACDSKDLSIQATFPTLIEMEKLGPNLVIGSMKHYLRGLFESNEMKEKVQCRILSKYVKESSVLSFHGGLETLIKGMKSRLQEMEVEIQTNNPVTKIRHMESGKFILHQSDKALEYDNVILATPAHITSTLLQGIIPNNELLNNIHWNNVAVVVLEYKGRLIPISGFGHLIPSWEIEDTLGVIYDSCIIPENDSQSSVTTRYTVMFGGAWFYPTIDKLDSTELINKARDVLKTQIGVDGEIARSSVAVHHKCIPVYGLKHKDLVETVRKSIEDKKLSIRLCGNSYDGVSISDCVHSAHKAVHSL